ncbi:MAG: beta-propeller fold lactonase family protein [Flavobacterium sp.]|nr:beta-propeller fold lactonase family protein [Flavobacterium sp.]
MYVYDLLLNTQTAEFKLKSTLLKSINPSYLTVSESKKYIYSVNENGSKSTISSLPFLLIRAMQLLNQQDAWGV